MGTSLWIFDSTMKVFYILPLITLASIAKAKSYSFDLTDVIQANEEIATKTNGHQMQAKSLDIVTSESSDRNQCQDKHSGCPGLKSYCASSLFWKNWMATYCPTSCGLCSGSGGQTCAKVPSWMKNAMSNRIINGYFAPSPIPWQVRLQPSFNSIAAYGFCGGTILDEETILTAAHCFYDKKSGTNAFPQDNGGVLFAGITQQGSTGQQKMWMKHVHIHPQYNKVTQDNDIAIVKLKLPLTFNNNVKNACLPEFSFVPQSKAVVSGWGATTFGGSTSSHLKYASVPFITHAKCVTPHTNYHSNEITFNMICAGFFTGETDSCQGDSGGPLVVPRSSTDDTAVIYGVVSWGLECAKAKQPGVYTRVTNKLYWIKSHMK